MPAIFQNAIANTFIGPSKKEKSPRVLLLSAKKFDNKHDKNLKPWVNVFLLSRNCCAFDVHQGLQGN